MLSVRGIREAVVSGARSAVDVCRDALARIDAVNPELNAFTTVAADRALARAEAIDRDRGGRCPHHAVRAWLRHRRIDPPACVAVRRRRTEADLRPGVAIRSDRARLVARSNRTDRDERL